MNILFDKKYNIDGMMLESTTVKDAIDEGRKKASVGISRYKYINTDCSIVFTDTFLVINPPSLTMLCKNKLKDICI